MTAAIEARNLAKVYRNGRGVLGIDLEIAQGEIFGFLGPNGAGKTTTIRALLGLSRITGGTARIAGRDVVHDSVDVRRVTGYLPGDPALYDAMTGRQHLELALRLRGIRDRRHALAVAERLGVEMDRKVRQLSRGNRQKVAILLALAHDPEVLLLDEPTSGLDPLAQDAFRDLLQEERERGRTVFFSSHVLPEVQALSDRVGVIRDGRLVAVDTVEGLRRSRLKEVRLSYRGEPPDVAGVAGVRGLEVKGHELSFHIAGDPAPLFRLLAERPPVDITIAEPSLEEVFRAYYGGQPS